MHPARTRFAPSPTGEFHIGGLRTVILNWLLARSTGGEFCLRIEDTDQSRKVDGAEGRLIWLITHLGFAPDIFLGRQSENLARYRKIADKLVAEGFAYRCYCTPQEVAARKAEVLDGRPGYDGYCLSGNPHSQYRDSVVRLIVPQGYIDCHDATRGTTSVPCESLTDPVILKADRWPTYHLASVVDDHDAGITHVLRGDEWMATWPYHIQIYGALGWEQPIWIHLPPVMGKSGKKLSKREGSTSVQSYLDMGILDAALINYLATVGCSWEGDEIKALDEMVDMFDLNRVQIAGGQFDLEKLLWFNQQWIRRAHPEWIIRRSWDDLVALKGGEDQATTISWEALHEMIRLAQPRIKTLAELPDHLRFFFKRPSSVDGFDVSIKGVADDRVDAVCSAVCNALRDERITWDITRLDDEKGIVEGLLRDVAVQHNVKLGALCMAIRIRITGSSVSLPIIESMLILGRDEVLLRLGEGRYDDNTDSSHRTSNDDTV